MSNIKSNVSVGSATFGQSERFALIAGPCAIESLQHALETAASLKEMAARVGVDLVL